MAKRGKRKNQRSNRNVKNTVNQAIEQTEKAVENTPSIVGIRWDKKTKAILNKTVKAFNAKLSRIEKQGKNLEAFMPERLSVKDLKKEIQTRAEFNRQIKRAQAFLKRGAEEVKVSEKGLAVTKWEIQQIRNLQQKAEYEHKKYLERMKAGSKKITTRAEEEERPIPKFDFKKRGYSEYQRYLAMLQKRLTGEYYKDKQELYLKNYIQSIYRLYGQTEKVDALVDHLENLGADEVVHQIYQDFDMTIEFTYDLTLAPDQLFDKLAEKWYKIKAE